ncbi:MAG: cytochrome ubiquinol oxidase subunit I [Actinobacteria bacterium]|jgi:cytochrome d ubiquinol oxidase subunit I|nr:cytochrome ubiquinol oxidase subunit I [Actinomycetota bacterium]
MNALDLARWQFGITTVYHFLFVPLTIGTSMLVAIMQTAWVRTGDEKWLKATKFFGKLFLINFAMGVVTGIVQEFQFGMSWSDYSRFVGDIFGAPLAVEGLASFFLESTFLGLWIFGWDRLPKKLHLATIWAAAIGTMLSAYFILAANSFMQHPVGYTFNPETNRAELIDFGAVLFQNTTVATFFHVIASAFLVSGVMLVGVSLLLMMSGKAADAMRKSLTVGIISTIIAGIAVMYTGDVQAKIMVQQQPMKMAAAEALYETQENAPFSLITIGNLDGSEAYWAIDIPGLLSFMATGNWTGPESTVQGINNLQAEYEQKYGPGEYAPYVPLVFWAFRAMIGLGMLGVLFALFVWWRTRKGKLPSGRWLKVAAGSALLFPLIGISAGWIFTEMGRQPWIVYSLMKTEAGVSPTLTTTQVWISIITFTLLYGALAVVTVGLMIRQVKIGPPESDQLETADANSGQPLTFSY